MARSRRGPPPHLDVTPNEHWTLSSPGLHKWSTSKQTRTTQKRNNYPNQSSPNEQIYLSDPDNGSKPGEDSTNT
eukprot:10300823-Ditylum_brightwellii.AAC.1